MGNFEISSNNREVVSGPTSSSQNRIFIFIIPLLGLVCLVAGIWIGIHCLNLALWGTTAPGTVVNSQSRTSTDTHGKTSTTYDTTIDFQTPDGVKHEFHNGEPGTQGQFIDVIYLAQNPEDAMVFSFGNLFEKPFLFIMVGGVFLAVFFALYRSVVARDQEIAQLVQFGRRDVGTIVGFVETGHSNVSGVKITQTGNLNSYQRNLGQYIVMVKTTNPATLAEMQLKSDPIDIEINTAMGLVGKEVPIYFSVTDSTSYFIDLRNLAQYDVNSVPNTDVGPNFDALSDVSLNLPSAGEGKGQPS